MEHIAKALVGIIVLAFLLSDASATHAMVFPIICNNLLALISIALILVAIRT